MTNVFDNIFPNQEESEDNFSYNLEGMKNNFFLYLNDSYENNNYNNNQLFNDDQFSLSENDFDYLKNKTEEEKEDRFDGNCNLYFEQKYKTEITKFEAKTRDTDFKKNYRNSNGKNMKQEKKVIISEQKSIYDANPNNSEKIFVITKEYNRKKILGRKSKFNLGGKHNKFSPDNIVRKFKTNIFEIILIFINMSIMPEKEIQKKNSEKKISIKLFLVKIDQKIIKTINVEDNLKLLESTLKDIFSSKISDKFKNLDDDKNKKIIEEIYEEKTQKKTIAILNKTFKQCLEHINGINYDEDLAGLEIIYKRIIKNLRIKENDEVYFSAFIDMVKNFELYYKNKKARKKSN